MLAPVDWLLELSTSDYINGNNNDNVIITLTPSI